MSARVWLALAGAFLAGAILSAAVLGAPTLRLVCPVPGSVSAR
jgi:hypothetical protein